MNVVAGVDEAGRGPLAGPVVAAAVILSVPITGLTDSKKLSAKRRDALAAEIRVNADAFGIGQATAQEIDALNIHHATLLAMRRAIEALPAVPDRLLVDGKFVPEGPWSGRAVVGGDAIHDCISAASILAKTTRDKLLCEMDREFPDYGFAQHKGYPTRLHLDALRSNGPCAEHRKSFAPVAQAVLSL